VEDIDGASHRLSVVSESLGAKNADSLHRRHHTAFSVTTVDVEVGVSDMVLVVIAILPEDIPCEVNKSFAIEIKYNSGFHVRRRGRVYNHRFSILILCPPSVVVINFCFVNNSVALTDNL